MRAAFSARPALALAGLGSFGGIFAVFLMLEVPGLGVGHFYYLSIALVALATGPVTGGAAGVLAVSLYTLGVVLNPNVPSNDALTTGAAIRLVTYAGIGILIGFFAKRDRALVERLRVLAERDFLTGLPNMRAFEAAIARRIQSGRPFALLLGDMDGLKSINDMHGHAEGNEMLQRLGSLLTDSLRPEDEVARVGGDEFAVLTEVSTGEDAAQLAARLEEAVRSSGTGITFGWAVSGQDGAEALTLFRAADQRLYARKFVRSRESGRLALAPAVGSR